MNEDVLLPQGEDDKGYLEAISSEAKKAYRGSAQQLPQFTSDLELFEQVTLSSDELGDYPFSCFGGIYDASNVLITVCCLVSRNKAITTCHSLFAEFTRANGGGTNNNNTRGIAESSSLRFESFLKRSSKKQQYQQQQESEAVEATAAVPVGYSCAVKSVQWNHEFKSIAASVEYDMAIVELEENLGDSLGYLGLLANARSDDFDIQSAQKPIILLAYDAAKGFVEYHTTLAMDVTYNYLTVFNVVSADAIAIVNDDEFGYAVVGVSSKTTLRQTVINTLNHEKFDTIHEWIALDANTSPVISKARKYLENKSKLQSKLIVGSEPDEREQERAHWSSVQSIVRVNNNCFASICYDGTLKMWNWKSGEQLCILQLPEEPPQHSKLNTASDAQSSSSLSNVLNLISCSNNDSANADQESNNNNNNYQARSIVNLEISGEFLLCLTSNSLIYYNWLTRKLEFAVQADASMPRSTTFTCMCCLANDMKILVGATDGRVYSFFYSQSESRYIFQSILLDFTNSLFKKSQSVQATTTTKTTSQRVTSILEISEDLILVGFASGALVVIDVSVTSDSQQSQQNQHKVLLESQFASNEQMNPHGSSTAINKILHFQEVNKIAVVLLDRIKVYAVEFTNEEVDEVANDVNSPNNNHSNLREKNVVDQEQVMSVGFMQGYLKASNNNNNHNSSSVNSNSTAAQGEEQSEQSPKEQPQIVVAQKNSVGGIRRKTIRSLSLKTEIKAESVILSACAINEQEIGMSWDKSIRIANIDDASKDSFTKDHEDIVAVSMLNSEGFITGDAGGKVRAWIIGFSSPLLQPAPAPPANLLEIIDELSEQSEDKSLPQQSHRSMSQEIEDVFIHDRTNSSISSVHSSFDQSNSQVQKDRFKKIDLNSFNNGSNISNGVVPAGGSGIGTSISSSSNSNSSQLAQQVQPEDVFEAYKKRMNAKLAIQLTGEAEEEAEVVVDQRNAPPKRGYDQQEPQVLVWKLERFEKENGQLKAEKTALQSRLVSQEEKVAELKENSAELEKKLQQFEQLARELEEKNIKDLEDSKQRLEKERKVNENLTKTLEQLEQKNNEIQQEYKAEKLKMIAEQRKKELEIEATLRSAHSSELSRVTRESSEKDAIIDSLRKEIAKAKNNIVVLPTSTTTPTKPESTNSKPSSVQQDHPTRSFDNFSKQSANGVSNPTAIGLLPNQSASIPNSYEQGRRRGPNNTPKPQLSMYTTSSQAVRQSVSNGFNLTNDSSQQKLLRNQQQIQLIAGTTTTATGGLKPASLNQDHDNSNNYSNFNNSNSNNNNTSSTNISKPLNTSNNSSLNQSRILPRRYLNPEEQSLPSRNLTRQLLHSHSPSIQVPSATSESSAALGSIYANPNTSPSYTKLGSMNNNNNHYHNSKSPTPFLNHSTLYQLASNSSTQLSAFQVKQGLPATFATTTTTDRSISPNFKTPTRTAEGSNNTTNATATASGGVLLLSHNRQLNGAGLSGNLKQQLDRYPQIELNIQNQSIAQQHGRVDESNASTPFLQLRTPPRTSSPTSINHARSYNLSQQLQSLSYSPLPSLSNNNHNNSSISCNNLQKSPRVQMTSGMLAAQMLNSIRQQPQQSVQVQASFFDQQRNVPQPNTLNSYGGAVHSHSVSLHLNNSQMPIIGTEDVYTKSQRNSIQSLQAVLAQTTRNPSLGIFSNQTQI